MGQALWEAGDKSRDRRLCRPCLFSTQPYTEMALSISRPFLPLCLSLSWHAQGPGGLWFLFTGAQAMALRETKDGGLTRTIALPPSFKPATVANRRQQSRQTRHCGWSCQSATCWWVVAWHYLELVGKRGVQQLYAHSTTALHLHACPPPPHPLTDLLPPQPVLPKITKLTLLAGSCVLLLGSCLLQVDMSDVPAAQRELMKVLGLFQGPPDLPDLPERTPLGPCVVASATGMKDCGGGGGGSTPQL
jgi:hypothetical protein